MKLSSLRRKLIWRIERDLDHPHIVTLYDIFGRKIMKFDSQHYGGTYGGDGNHWEDGDQVWSKP